MSYQDGNDFQVVVTFYWKVESELNFLDWFSFHRYLLRSKFLAHLVKHQSSQPKCKRQGKWNQFSLKFKQFSFAILRLADYCNYCKILQQRFMLANSSMHFYM